MSNIMDFLKKQRISFYISALAAILTLAGLIVFMVSNATQGYSMNNGAWIIVAGIAAVILICSGTYAAGRFGAKPWVVAMMFVALILLCVSFGFVLLNRADLAATLSTYDTGNALGQRAFSTGITAIAFYLVAAIILTVNAFLKSGTK